jgi:hypothetical protein
VLFIVVMDQDSRDPSRVLIAPYRLGRRSRKEPHALRVFEFFEVEGVNQNAFFGFVEFLHLLAELVGDERRA